MPSDRKSLPSDIHSLSLTTTRAFLNSGELLGLPTINSVVLGPNFCDCLSVCHTWTCKSCHSLQEKFKREFQQRFPFHSRQDWVPPDSMDLDKLNHSAIGTRSSVLRSCSSTYRPGSLSGGCGGCGSGGVGPGALTHDWRRAYSARSPRGSPRCYPPPPRNYPSHIGNGNPDTLYRPYAARLAVTASAQGGHTSHVSRAGQGVHPAAAAAAGRAVPIPRASTSFIDRIATEREIL